MIKTKMKGWGIQPLLSSLLPSLFLRNIASALVIAMIVHLYINRKVSNPNKY